MGQKGTKLQQKVVLFRNGYSDCEVTFLCNQTDWHEIWEIKVNWCPLLNLIEEF